MEFSQSDDPDEKKDDPVPVWTPPPSGGTTEPTEYPIGQLDPEEEALNQKSSGS